MFVTKFNTYRKPPPPVRTIDNVLVANRPTEAVASGVLDSGFDDLDLQRVTVGPSLFADFAGNEPRLERR